jgi:hypothetical protein
MTPPEGPWSGQGPTNPPPGTNYPGQGYPPAPPPQGFPPPGGYPQGGYGQVGLQPGNGLAVAGFVLSLVGIFILWFICGTLGIIFGAIGLQRANRGAKYRGLAIAAVVIGVIDIVGYIILLAAIGFTV